MQTHRIRLNDSDLDLIVAALRARLAMTHGDRRHEYERLIERLRDLGVGNPRLRLDWNGQEHRLVTQRLNKPILS